uniref:E3 ubiquitin-protein ligase Topors n=1 Tax=Sinocyclocheilus rhinocerous TaxID=307959 RepID=A0A673H0E4_9TELE
MMASSKMKLRVRKRDSAGKSSQRLLANASPDSKCPICLDGFNNVASLDRCLHQFCFRCIHEWSKNKAECPLCKQPFHSIFHSVKGENDFKEFVLRPPENGAPANADPPERVLRPRVLRGRERRSHRAQNPAPSSSPPDAGRQRDISAVFLRQNPGCLRRLLPWLQRELMDSAIRDELRPFLLARTDHFLHELVSFARSTLNMEVYDQQAVYDCPAPSYEEGSSSDLSVIAISEDDDDNDSEDNVTENPSAVQERLASVATASGAESLPSQSAWDDETPGPSYSTLLPSSSQSYGEGAEPSASTTPPLSALDMTDPVTSGRVSAGPGEDNEEEECLIVGYVKPMAERTPELVQLSSDSSEEEQEPATTETMASVMKSEASQVQLPLQSHMIPISPIGSHSREQEADYLSFRGHQSKDGSRSHSRQSRGDSRCRGHKRHRSHRRSGSKEKDKSLEQSRHVKTPDCSPSQTQSWTQSPAVSVWSGSPASKSHSSDCSPSRNKSGEHSRHARERFSHSPANSRRRRTKESRSPDLDSFLGSHHPCEAKRCRKRRKRSVSSSGADSHSEKSCLDKPSGKRKYKTRHLERARRRSRERSPSVEIIYEQRPPDPYWVQRRKRRHRKRRRELRSPTVITIDSDSDRTIDCLDRVMDVIDQTAADVEQRDETPKQDSIQNASCTLDSSNSLSEPSSPMGRSDPITERTLNLDDCVVDVVDHSSSDCSRNMGASNHQEFIPNPFPVDSIIMAPPSDVRLLETILQDLVDFLPGAEREMGPSSPGQQEPASSQQKYQSEIGRRCRKRRE